MLLDVAFGEYILKESQKIAHLVLNAGGVVIGSISKMQGLPGSRIGYAIFSETLTTKYKKISGDDRLLLDINSIGNEIIHKLFVGNSLKRSKAQEYAEESAKEIRNINKEIDEVLKNNGLITLSHNGYVPIRAVYGPEIQNLKQWFSDKGILVESLSDYASTIPKSSRIDLKKYVRMLVPSRAKIKLLTKLLSN